MMIKKKEIQRHRMVRYFVEAACSIADSQGTDAVTARKVAELAGYNAATLYNYFDNLPHLLYFIHLRQQGCGSLLPKAGDGKGTGRDGFESGGVDRVYCCLKKR